jgi:putative ABC transport system permease protein
VLAFWLGAVASVSLAVGAISVMNIMLVAVAERTREIGLRMAVGALRRDIMWQFLTESLLLALLGRLTGVGLAIGLSLLIAQGGGLPVVIKPWALAVSLGAAGIAGVMAGILPALKAAGLTPIHALRAE